MELEERHQLVTYLIHHLRRNSKVERFACYGLQLVSDTFNLIINQDRSLIDREFPAHGKLSEATIISNEVS